MGHVFYLLYQLQVLIKVITLETWRKPAIVTCLQVFKFLDLTGKKSPAQGTISYESYAQLLAGLQHTIFRITGPERIFTLQGSNGMHKVGFAQCSGIYFT